MGIKVVFRDLGTQLDKRSNDLAPLLVRQADHHHFFYCWVQGEHVFDFRRADVFAAGDDQVIDTPRDEQIALPIEVADVTGEIPSVT
ncbi:hypothetical protein D3C72_2311180 [compost metagenome]